MKKWIDWLAYAAKSKTVGADDRIIKIDPIKYLVDPTSGLKASGSWTFDDPFKGTTLKLTDPRSPMFNPFFLWDEPAKKRRPKGWFDPDTIRLGWDMWREQRSYGGNPLMAFYIGKLTANISWGPTRDHVRPGDWGPTAKWYVDLEIEGDGTDLPTPATSRLVGHVERGFPTQEQAQGAAEWLRSCVEVAGLHGLLALNSRSGGDLA